MDPSIEMGMCAYHELSIPRNAFCGYLELEGGFPETLNQVTYHCRAIEYLMRWAREGTVGETDVSFRETRFQTAWMGVQPHYGALDRLATQVAALPELSPDILHATQLLHRLVREHAVYSGVGYDPLLQCWLGTSQEQPIQSVSDFQAALTDASQSAHGIFWEALRFLHEASQARDEAVKPLMVELVQRKMKRPRTRKWIQAHLIRWLGAYQDPSLFDLWVSFLPAYPWEASLALLALDDPRAAEPIAWALAREELPPRERGAILQALAAAGNAAYLGVIERYLTHPHPLVRGDAAWALVALGGQTGHDEVVAKVLPYRDDPDPSVRLKVAYRIGMNFPQAFYTLDMGRSLYEALWPPCFNEDLSE